MAQLQYYKERLTAVLDVVVKSLTSTPGRYSLDRRIINLPRIKEWLHKKLVR